MRRRTAPRRLELMKKPNGSCAGIKTVIVLQRFLARADCTVLRHRSRVFRDFRGEVCEYRLGGAEILTSSARIARS